MKSAQAVQCVSVAATDPLRPYSDRQRCFVGIVVVAAEENRLYLFVIPVWLLRGKAALEAQIASRVAVDPAALPDNREFVK